MSHIIKKRFGQNFLQDEYIIMQIIASIKPDISETMVEIGPGLGALTTHLLAQVHHLHLIEIDFQAIHSLQQRFKAQTNFVIHQGDVLKFDFATLPANIRIVGNLPYNISTPFFRKIIATLVKINFYLTGPNSGGHYTSIT